MSRNKFNAFRDGRVHVKGSQCATCIFKAGNLMRLEPGRVEEMVAEARADDSAIICHDTLDEKEQSVCLGFYHRHATTPLRLARDMGVIEWDQ